MAVVQTMAKIKDDITEPQRREGPVPHVGPRTHDVWDPTLWDRAVISALEQALGVAKYARAQEGPARDTTGGDRA
eukprot:7463271-Alexandrium_andersonii.AAC.1